MKYINTTNCRQNLFSGSSLRDIEKELNILFGQLPSRERSRAAGPKNTRSVRNLNWYENEDAYVVRLDLPGVKSADVSLEVEAGVLDLKAKRSSSAAEEGAAPEYSYVASLKVPDGVKVEEIAAELKDGVIGISFPKEEKAKARRIEVQQSN